MSEDQRGSEFRLRRGGTLVVGATLIEFLRYEQGAAVLYIQAEPAPAPAPAPRDREGLDV